MYLLHNNKQNAEQFFFLDVQIFCQYDEKET